MNWQDAASVGNILTALVAIISLTIMVVLNYNSQRSQSKINANLANYESLLAADEMLFHVPEALRFEGVSEEDFASFKKAGITLNEAVYLYMHFKAGARYHKIVKSKDISPYHPGHYRHVTLSIYQTRIAWSVFRKVISDCPFKKKMDATVAALEIAYSGFQVGE